MDGEELPASKKTEKKDGTRQANRPTSISAKVVGAGECFLVNPAPLGQRLDAYVIASYMLVLSSV